MNNANVFKFFAVISFGISGLLTIMLMTSGTVGLIPCLITSCMAICLEVAKCGLAYQAISNKSLKSGIRIAFGGISILIIIASILASAAFVQNQANKTKNLQLKGSTQFKQTQEARKLQQDLYNQTKNEISTLQLNKEKVISDMERIRDSYPRNYITVKENLQQKINSKSAELQSVIDQKATQMSQISQTLQSPIDMSKVQINDSEGYNAMFRIIADGLNKSEEGQENPISPEQVALYFFISLGIIFEAVAVSFTYLAQHYSYVEQVEKQPVSLKNNVLGFKPKNLEPCETTMFYGSPEVEKPRAQIGFQIQPKQELANISNEDLRKYLEYMYQTSKDGVSTGYIRIGRETRIGVETARKVKGYLENIGVIQTVGNRTMIIKQYSA